MAEDFEDIDFDSLVDQDSGSEGESVRAVFGTAENIEALGAPSEQDERIAYYFFPTWRSQTLNLIGFVVLCILGVIVTKYVPASIIVGSLFSLGDTTYYLHLPLLILLPGAMLGKVLIHIYDAKFIVDENGVEAQIGLVSLNLRQPRLRWEDIRGVEPNQTIWERILGIGSVLIGSAMTQDVEIVMSGVANPRAIQLLIGGERDRRLKELQSQGGHAVRASGVLGE